MYKLDEDIPLSQAKLSGKHTCQQAPVPGASPKLQDTNHNRNSINDIKELRKYAVKLVFSRQA